MVQKSFVNPVQPVEVSLGIEHLIIGNYPTTYTPARIDLDALPTGFMDLGAVVEDTPSLKYSRTKFALETGLPKVRQFEAVQAVSATFAATLHSNSWRKAQVALGNFTATASATAVGTVASVTSDNLTFVLTTTPTTPLVVGQQIIVTTVGNFDGIDATEVRIASITTGNLIFTVTAPPVKTMVANCIVGVYARVTQHLGGNALRYFSLLGITDFLDGVQIVHELRKVAPAEDFEEMFRPDANGKVPLSFNALAFQVTQGGCTQQVVASRHYFPPLSASC